MRNLIRVGGMCARRMPAVFALALAAGVTAGCATGQSGGKITVRYSTLNIPSSNPVFLEENIASAKSVQGLSYLQLPAAGNAPYPLVLVLPHSGGIDEGAWRNARLMRKRGWATMVVDPYKPRNAKKYTAEYQEGLTEASYTHDIHRALDAVHARPDIDMTRIAAIGVSWGGGVQIPLESPWHQNKYGAKHSIKAHVMVSPLCWITEREPQPSAAKILMILSMKDEENPPQPCLDYAGRLSAAGADIEVMKQPKSGHTALGGKLRMKPTLVWRNCEIVWEKDTFAFSSFGKRYNLKTDYGKMCLPGTETLLSGADPKEKQRAWKRIFEFIESAFM